MNKFTKLILTSAVFATSGFAATGTTTISGTENISAGATKEIASSDVVLTGTMALAGSDTEGNAAKLIIDADRTLDIQGGTLTYDGQGTYKPQITLNGTMKLSPDTEGANPTLNLGGANIAGKRYFINTRYNSDGTPNAITYDYIGEKEIQGISAIFGTNNGRESFFMTIDDKLYERTNIYMSTNSMTISCDEQHKNWIKGDLGFRTSYSFPIIVSERPDLFDQYPESMANLSGYAISGTYSTEENSEVTFDPQPSWDDLENDWCKAYTSCGTIFAKKSIHATGYEYDLKLLVTNDISSQISAASATGMNFISAISRTDNIGSLSDITTLGNFDMSTLRTYAADNTKAEEPIDLSANISGIKPAALGTAKLPFNCKFSNVDLSNVDNVEYTKLSVGESSAPGVDENGIIKKVITQAAATYGDYKNDKSLGVTTTADGTKQEIAGNQEQLKLIELTANKEKYNKTSLKLYTNDLDDVAMTISEDTTYNFGFIGSKNIN